MIESWAARQGHTVSGTRLWADDGVEALVDNCRAELVPTEWVQSEEQILGGRAHLPAVNQIMERLLDYCARTVAAAR